MLKSHQRQAKTYIYVQFQKKVGFLAFVTNVYLGPEIDQFI